MRFDNYMFGDDGDDEVMDNDESSEMMGVVPSSKDARVIRECIMDEMETINNYIERAEGCTNDAVRKMLLDIAEEERDHFSDFEMALDAVDPLQDNGEEVII